VAHYMAIMRAWVSGRRPLPWAAGAKRRRTPAAVKISDGILLLKKCGWMKRRDTKQKKCLWATH